MTGVKTLPCPKLSLWAVTIIFILIVSGIRCSWENVCYIIRLTTSSYMPTNAFSGRKVFIVTGYCQYYYRPQRSWGEVIFSQAPVILFTGGGGSASVHAGILLPGKTDPPPGKADPPAQCMLGDTVIKRAVCIPLECTSCLYWEVFSILFARSNRLIFVYQHHQAYTRLWKCASFQSVVLVWGTIFLGAWWGIRKNKKKKQAILDERHNARKELYDRERQAPQS